ncbi:hypothetical protein [Dyadobacter fanqingshengii]|uniref:Uncharacterized protein n=1 Tax=Dyadobacter fanqingshengii TaxID=2906443 RepID=A0A9X1PC09_9BACT|nr:hypothetical protein [Dyadobacter fanqingshengii]MCF0041143.1 hypothetical protein [Dyadobacter fanqingshengii]MCF2505750.1 hypothetical protein [Dyadobacter fanqingshengii]USJ37131.1 hypothetical protein NFI81_04985 [Dyadobacter fanqingshengii]
MEIDDKTELSKKIEALLAEGDAAIADARSYLISQGELVDLSEWVTIKEYCHRFEIKNVETVLNWISRGIVPRENIMVVEEFNNTKLIKAVPYAVRGARVL